MRNISQIFASGSRPLPWPLFESQGGFNSFKRLARRGSATLVHSIGFSLQRSALPNLERQTRKLNESNIATAGELTIDRSKVNARTNCLAQIWSEYFHLPTIPFSIEERRRLLAGAYDKLKAYINVWEQPEPDSWRGKLVASLRKR